MYDAIPVFTIEATANLPFELVRAMHPHNKAEDKLHYYAL
jgi:hypothetical protein